MTIERSTPQERFAASPRPLHFVRIRLYRGGQAEFIRDSLRDLQADLLEDLGDLRTKGKSEDDEEIVEIRQQLVWLINALADLDRGLLELVGPDADPR